MKFSAPAKLTQWLGAPIVLFSLSSTSRVFSRDVALGGEIAFVGREKCEEYSKNKRNLLLFGGEIQNLGGEISPPKGPEKNTVYKSLTWQF